MGGGKSGSTGTQTQNSTVSIPPEVLARYNSVNATAENVAQTPFQPYTGQFVAPVNDTQQNAIQNITGAQGWIPGTYNNTVGTISAGVAGAHPYYNAAGSNIGSGLAGGQGANQTALNQFGSALGAAQPYNAGAGASYGAAAGLAGAGTGAVNPGALNTGAYMSPYNDAVVQSTMALLGQQQQQQQMGLTTQQILGGSFGGDRSGIDKAVLSGQQNLASANVASNLYNQNYAQALGAAQQQQGVGLGAAQANRQALQTGANQFQGIGQAVQGLGQQVYGQGTGQAAFTGQIGQQGYQQALGAAGAQTALGQAQFGTDLAAAQGYGQAGAQALQSQLAQGQAQLGAGTVQQQTDQANLQAQYNQFLQQQAYPFQTTQFLANIAEGTGALSGSSTSANNYTPQPFFSDRRLKENIKTIAHSKAGIPIVQYNYKGDKRTQIGMIAQDVEKKRPEAVGSAQGFKTVDYERALRADGGAIGLAGGGPAMMIYHIGGSVDESDAGRGFGTGYADGGSPGMDSVAMAQILAAHQAMYPGSAGRPGLDAGPRGMQLHQPSGHSLMKAELIKPQGQQDTGLHDTMKGVGDVAGGAKGASELYSMGKDAAVGSAAKGTPGTPGYTPATGGLAGDAGKWDPQSGWFGKLGLGAANSNTPTPSASSSITSSSLPDITPPPTADATIADAGSGLVDDALDTAWAWRGGRQGRDAGGPTLQEIGDTGMNQARLVGGTPPGVGKNPFNPGSFAGTEWAKGKPGQPAPPDAPVAGPGGVPMFMGMSGSANGATGSGGDAAGGASGSGGVGGSASDGAGGSAAAGTSDGGDGSGTYREGGAVDRALRLARRPKRYATGGMPYGDAGDGYIPDDLYEPVDVDKLEKEQKGMEAPAAKLDQGKGGGKDQTGKTIGSLAGGLAGMYFGPAGSAVGSGLGGLLGGMFHGGGRAGFEDGGAPDPADLMPTDDSSGNVIPFKKREGLNPPAALELPKRETETPAPAVGLNPERPAAREGEDKAASYAEPGNYVDEKPPGLNPTPAAPTPAPTVPPTPVPGLAPPANVSEPPGFRAPGMQQDRKVDVHGNILQRESGNSHWGADGQPKRGDAGEVGAGQIMPGTGPIAARDAGVPWNPALFNQPKTGDKAKDDAAEAYNRTLSSGHFKALTQTFGGDETKAAAAYNCGEQCVKDAVSKYGTGWMQGIPGSTRQYVAAVTGQGGGGNRALALNAPGLGGAAAGPATPSGLAGPTPPRDFFDRAGDWVDRNEKRIVPALAFLGSMLASPSRTLAGSVGSGMVGGAKALQGQQELGQGQQRIDITKNAQLMSLWSQLRTMYANQIATSGKADPQIKAQMDRVAAMISNGTGSGGPGGAPVPGGPPSGGPDLPAGGPSTDLAPPAGSPPPSAPAASGAPVSGTPVTNPPATPGPTPAVTAQDPPSMRQPNVDFPPDFRSKLDPNQDPIELRRRAQAIEGTDPGSATRLREEANQVQKRMLDTGFAQGKDGNQIPVPNANALKVSQARVEDNLKWQTDQAPVQQQRQQMRHNVEQIVRSVQQLEPGAFAGLKADLQAAAQGIGFTPKSTATMNADEYQAFVKNVAAVISGNPTGDGKTDMARQILKEGFAHPDLNPKPVRRILSQALGYLDSADDFYKDVTDKLVRAPHLNRSQRVDEFNNEPGHKINDYTERHEKNIAVRGDVPDKIDADTVGKAYIMTPQDVFKLMPKGSDTKLDDVRKQFGGAGTMRFRVKVIDGRAKLVPENG